MKRRDETGRPAEPAAPSRRGKWLVFGAVAPGTFAILVDEFGINQAIPPIAASFNATIPAVQWVVLAYLLTAGALLLPLGRVADILGHRRVYLVGLVIFTGGAVLAGFSPNLVTLVLSKGVQAAGAALIQAASLPIIVAAFPSVERGKAIGLFVGVLALGALFGPVVGGGVVSWLGWRFFLFMSVPLGLLALSLAIKVLGAGPSTDLERAQKGERSFDWIGAALGTTALAVFLLVVTRGNDLGWGSPITIAGFVAVVLLAVAFVAWEGRTRNPILPLAMLTTPVVMIGQAAMFLTVLGNTALFFLLPFYLQDVTGMSPLVSGLVVAVVPATFIMTGPWAGALSDRWGWRRFISVGMAGACVAMLILSRIGPDTSVAAVVGALALMGWALGFVFPPAQNAVFGAVDADKRGILTAFVNMGRNIGQLSSIAIGAAIVTGTMASLGYEASLDAVKQGEQGVAVAFTMGLSRAFVVGAVVIFVGFLVSLLPPTGWRALRGHLRLGSRSPAHDAGESLSAP